MSGPGTAAGEEGEEEHTTHPPAPTTALTTTPSISTPPVEGASEGAQTPALEKQ